MSLAGDQGKNNPGETIFSRTLITVAFQVGCLTFVLIIASLIVGLWLDRSFDTLPLFTILFLVGSMPVSWVLVFRLVNKFKGQFIRETSLRAAKTDQEEVDSD